MIRDNKHLKFIRSLPCCVCLKTFTVQAAHVRKTTNGGMGLKPDDNFTVPLCSEHHIKQHTIGEVSFWNDLERPKELSNALYLMTGDKEKAIHHIIRFNRVFRNPR